MTPPLSKTDHVVVKHSSRGLQTTDSIPLVSVSHSGTAIAPPPSPQQIPLIDRKVMHQHELPEFIGKRDLHVMLPLPGNITDRPRNLRMANGKRTVTVLPRKPAVRIRPDS